MASARRRGCHSSLRKVITMCVAPPIPPSLAAPRPRASARRRTARVPGRTSCATIKRTAAISRMARSSARPCVPPPRAPRRATPPRRALDAVCALGGSETAAGDDRMLPPRATAGLDGADSRRRLVLPASGGAHDGVAAPARPLRRRRARRREEPGQPAGRVVLVRQPNGDLLARPAESPEELPPPPTGARRLVRRFHRLSLPRSRVLLAARGPEEPRPRAPPRPIGRCQWSGPISPGTSSWWRFSKAEYDYDAREAS